MTCRICDETDLKEMFSWPKFPIYIWPIDEDCVQEYERLQVYWCPDCGLVQLGRFDNAFIQKLYSKEVFGLVASLEFLSTSIRNNDFLQYCFTTLGHDWSHGKRILDVGGYDVLTCFDLDFSEGVICDPNAPEIKEKSNVKICRDFFSQSSFEKNSFDVVIAKHVLEHVNDVSSFMNDIRYVLKDNGKLIIEVPELIDSIERPGSFAVFYHQHLSYFDKFSLKNLLMKFGFHIIDMSINKNNLRVIAEKAYVGESSVDFKKDGDIPKKLREYKSNLEKYFEGLEQFLRENHQEKIICYGAGGGTTLLLHLCEPIRDFIEVVVDSSKNKLFKRIGGTNFTVMPSETLESFSGRNILVNSCIFFEEIVNEIRRKYEKCGFCILKIYPEFEKIHLSTAEVKV